MGKEMNRTAQRDEILSAVKGFLEEYFDTWCEPCGSGEIIMPAIDENGEEFYFKFKASIPRGTRNGAGGYNGFDGDAAVKTYRKEQEIKAQERAAKEAEKQRKIDEKKRKAEAKKVVKKLNKDGLDKMIHEGE